MSTRVLEMQSMKKEEEMHQMTAQMINDFQKKMVCKLGRYAKWATKLVKLDGETRIPQERFATKETKTQQVFKMLENLTCT